MEVVCFEKRKGKERTTAEYSELDTKLSEKELDTRAQNVPVFSLIINKLQI